MDALLFIGIWCDADVTTKVTFGGQQPQRWQPSLESLVAIYRRHMQAKHDEADAELARLDALGL